MKYDIDVNMTISTTDGLHSLVVSISDFIIEECCSDGVLFEQWQDNFSGLGDEWAQCWSEVADDLPEMQALMEHYWAEEEKGNEVGITYTVDPKNVLPLLKKYNSKYYEWMIGFGYQVRAVEELTKSGVSFSEDDVVALMNKLANNPD